MTIGAPDFQDVRQPQPSGDRLVYVELPPSLTTFSETLAAAVGIYPYYAAQFTPTNAIGISVSLDLPGQASSFTLNRFAAAGAECLFVFPAAGFLNAVPTIQGTFSAAPGGSYCLLTVYGYRVFPDGLRYDGLYSVQNSQVATLPPTAGTSFPGPTLPSPQRMLIGGLIPPGIVMGGTAGVASIEGTVNGVTAALTTGQAGAEGAMDWQTINFGDGVLLDPGTGLEMTLPSSGSNVSGAVYYDVVT